MDGVVVICALILNPRARRRRETALSVVTTTSGTDNSPSSAVSGTLKVGNAGPTSEKSGVRESHSRELPGIIDIERGARIKTSRN